MPGYIVTMNENATDEQVKSAEMLAESQGGTITHRYTLMKAFAVEYPEGTVMTLGSHEHVNSVELDKVMTTQ
ncbi:Uncharacterized protein ESCO_005237 [Escovopsis weberi]|uniref:Inhibitor I9 domain-containing protein n=1 Tax=Escovopsis weberi TaxID=150374 RepID=A0A0M8N284_ESCWE|nr:Uncharacterized protein ESCO_005237 [Escovopsis weberi]